MDDSARTSGDLTADRRFAYAEGLARDGEFAPAADLVRQGLELAPRWAAGWFRLGEMLELAGEPDRAAEAYRTCLGLSPSDRLGAALKLALLEGTRPALPPLAYAEALFDDYAGTFDEALTNRLGYRVPALLRAMLDECLPGASFETALDLGCGTGLMGEEVRGRCMHLSGADLSAGMLEKAKVKQIYDRLLKTDLRDALAGERNVSLVMAADVFMYVPELDDVFAATAGALDPGGHFLFSVEKANDPDTWTLLPSRRHAHGSHLVGNLLDRHGFAIVGQREDTIRMDAGEPLTGLLWLARLDSKQP